MEKSFRFSAHVEFDRQMPVGQGYTLESETAAFAEPETYGTTHVVSACTLSTDRSAGGLPKCCRRCGSSHSSRPHSMQLGIECKKSLPQWYCTSRADT